MKAITVPFGDISHLGLMGCAAFAEGGRRLGWTQRRQAAILQQLTWGWLWYGPNRNTIWNTATRYQEWTSAMEHKSMVDDVSIWLLTIIYHHVTQTRMCLPLLVAAEASALFLQSRLDGWNWCRGKYNIENLQVRTPQLGSVCLTGPFSVCFLFQSTFNRPALLTFRPLQSNWV